MSMQTARLHEHKLQEPVVPAAMMMSHIEFSRAQCNLS
jgi:hypothetical protein